MKLMKKGRKYLSILLSLLLLFSNIFGGALGILAMEQSREEAGHLNQPNLIMDGANFFTPKSDYLFSVTSDKDGLLTITLEGHETIIVDSEPIEAGEAFEVKVGEMPSQEAADFIITVRPRNDDFENPAVTAFAVFSVIADQLESEAVIEGEEVLDEEIADLNQENEKVDELDDEEDQAAIDEAVEDKENELLSKSSLNDSGYRLTGIDHHWNLSLFGDLPNDSQKSVSNEITDDSVQLTVWNSSGRLASTSDGIYFFNTILNPEEDFILTATISEVETGTAINSSEQNPNQSGAGLMVRGDLQDEQAGRNAPFMIGIGASNNRVAYRRNEGGGLSRQTLLPGEQSSEQSTHVMLQKIGNTFIVAYDGIIHSIDGLEEDGIYFRDEQMYVGLFVARNANTTFSDINLEVLEASNTPVTLDVSIAGPFFQGTELDKAQLNVNANFADGSNRWLEESEFHVTDFDTSTIGTHTATVHFRGTAVLFTYEVIEDSVINLEVVAPIKVEYAIDQPFNQLGMRVMTERASGKSNYLSSTEYDVLVNCEIVDINDLSFNEPGVIPITIVYSDNPEYYDIFEVEVMNRTVENLKIDRQPHRTEFIVGQQAPETASHALVGSIIQAQFSDGHYEVIQLNTETGFTMEYDVDFINTVGKHIFEITYMGVSTEIEFTVIDQEAVGLWVVEYPQTTYFIKDELNLEGLNVAIVYNDATLSDELTANDYQLDTSSFNSEVSGVYTFPIVGSSSKTFGLEGELRVIVREIEDFTSGWDHIVYGQSATLEGNTLDVAGEFGTIGPETTIELNTTDGRGKIADGHDGINYYYRPLNVDDNFVLSADIEVISVGTLDQNIALANQVGFGLMMTDRIGEHGDTSVWHSSMALAGSRGQSNQAFWSAWTRDNRPLELDGITPLNHRIGATVNGQTHGRVIGPDFQSPSQAIPRLYEVNNPSSKAHVVLERANNQIIAEITMNGEVTRYELDHDIPFDIYDQDHIYVGFFTARDAHIKVSNANLTVTSSKTDAPGPIIEQPLVTPSLTIRSLDYSSTEDYEVIFSANADGQVEVFQNSQLIDTVEVEENRVARIPAELDKGRHFTLRYTPDSTLDHISNFDSLIEIISVTHLYTEGDIYVSPTGNGLGTAKHPMSFNQAVRELQPGNTIILTEGVYPQLVIPQWNSGREADLKRIVAQGDVVIQGARLDGDFWHLYDLRFNNGVVRVGGNDNIVELATISNAPDTGLQISRSVAADRNIHFDIESWPSRNLILNSESYNNMDRAQTDADGFAAKLTVGEGNRFIGCVSHHNIDDGWDLYAKSVPIGEVLIENSIAHSNGRLIGWANMGPTHMGNGFKLGGEGVPVAHTIRNSIAFHNGSHGFSSNSNPMLIADNNVSFDNRLKNISLTSYTNIELRDYQVTNFFSYRIDTETWGNDADVIEAGSFGTKRYTGESVYLFAGDRSVNSLDRMVVDDFFESTEVPENLGAGSFRRDLAIADGEGNVSLPSQFLELTSYAYQHTIEHVRQALREFLTKLENKNLQDQVFEKNLWYQYEAALKQANDVLENSRLTREIEQVHSQLEKAFSALENGSLPEEFENPELEAARQNLQELIDKVTELIESGELLETDYTKYSWLNLINVLEQAKLVMSSEDIKVIEAAYENLTEALTLLEKISTEDPEVDPNDVEEGDNDSDKDGGVKENGVDGDPNDKNKDAPGDLPNAGQNTLTLSLIGVALIGLAGFLKYAKSRKN